MAILGRLLRWRRPAWQSWRTPSWPPVRRAQTPLSRSRSAPASPKAPSSTRSKAASAARGRWKLARRPRPPRCADAPRTTSAAPCRGDARGGLLAGDRRLSRSIPTQSAGAGHRHGDARGRSFTWGSRVRADLGRARGAHRAHGRGRRSGWRRAHRRFRRRSRPPTRASSRLYGADAAIPSPRYATATSSSMSPLKTMAVDLHIDPGASANFGADRHRRPAQRQPRFRDAAHRLEGRRALRRAPGRGDAASASSRGPLQARRVAA